MQGSAPSSRHPTRQSVKDSGVHSYWSQPGTLPPVAHASQAGTRSRRTRQLSGTHIWPGNESMIAAGLGLCQNPDVRASLSSRTPGSRGQRSTGSGIASASCWVHSPPRALIRCLRPILPLQSQGTVPPSPPFFCWLTFLLPRYNRHEYLMELRKEWQNCPNFIFLNPRESLEALWP